MRDCGKPRAKPVVCLDNSLDTNYKLHLADRFTFTHNNSTWFVLIFRHRASSI